MNYITKFRILKKLKLYDPLRYVSYKLENRSPKVLNFYRQFIKPGDLCFDIGANIGQKTDIFLNLGARVITVEPQKDCLAFLQKKYGKNKNVSIVPKAVSDSNSTRNISLIEANALSTFSPTQLQSVQQMGFTVQSVEKIETVTLDSLIKLYGKPHFCKVDVEGHEPLVFKGLSQPIPYIGFEANADFLHETESSIQTLNRIGYREFNIAHDVHFANGDIGFMLPQFTDLTTILAQVHNLAQQRIFVDVYARHQIYL